MYADGYISINKKTIELHTSLNDFECHFLLLSFINHNNYTINIKKNSIKTRVHDYGLSKLLIDNRVINRKTHNGNFPLIKTNVKDFLRGYFDGDGYQGVDRVEFSAKRRKILEQLKTYYLSPLKISCTIRKHKAGYYLLRIYKDRHKFLDYIYSDINSFGLARKKDKYKNVYK